MRHGIPVWMVVHDASGHPVSMHETKASADRAAGPNDRVEVYIQKPKRRARKARKATP